jgi:SH3 domain-containing protein
MKNTARTLPIVVCFLLLALMITACLPNAAAPAANTATVASASSTPAATSAPATAEAATSPAPTGAAPVANNNVLYEDNFTNPSTNWPSAKFDNYFIGYHEPEYYHIEIDSPNYKTSVFMPDKQTFDDVTIEVKALANSKKTAATGDFLFGPIFRRSGDNYYAFAISARTKKWFVLKSSPSELTTLAEGSDASIHDADTDDLLRVDSKGSTFYFSINDHMVAQVTDADYVSGEVGFYVQTLDVTQAHIHFDDLTIRKFEAPKPAEPLSTPLFEDSFTNPSTGWAQAKFDNYFIGYHEPEYYHIEIDSPNYKTSAFLPGKKSFDDVTLEVKVLANSKKTAATGDFIFGPIFRRSGDNYYAFAISPRTKKWFVLKSSPNKLTTLLQGTDASIHDADVDDILRVDAQGSTFYFHINGRLVGQMSDSDYASGEVGFYVQTFDVAQAHIHFDELKIWSYDTPRLCTVATSAASLNVRSGPGKTYPSFTAVRSGINLEPLGHSSDDQWLKISWNGGDKQGWVSNNAEYISCSTDTSTLPLIIGP